MCAHVFPLRCRARGNFYQQQPQHTNTTAIIIETAAAALPPSSILGARHAIFRSCRTALNRNGGTEYLKYTFRRGTTGNKTNLGVKCEAESNLRADELINGNDHDDLCLKCCKIREFWDIFKFPPERRNLGAKDVELSFTFRYSRHKLASEISLPFSMKFKQKTGYTVKARYSEPQGIGQNCPLGISVVHNIRSVIGKPHQFNSLPIFHRQRLIYSSSLSYESRALRL